MRKAMLPDNLIKRYTLFKRALPAICLGLLPSQVFATTQECVEYPDCATLGYTQTSCGANSISLSCPFDVSKLFCTECASDKMYDSANNECVDSKTYCANLGKPFDTATGKCGSCGTTETFVKSQMKCVNKCVAKDWNTQVPTNNICIKDTSLGVTCYRDCVPTSDCGTFTGYVNDGDIVVISSVDDKPIAIARDDGYYIPYMGSDGAWFTYNDALDNADSLGYELPTDEESDYIDQIEPDWDDYTYWTSTECDTGYYYLSNDECTEETTLYDADAVILLTKCASK